MLVLGQVAAVLKDVALGVRTARSHYSGVCPGSISARSKICHLQWMVVWAGVNLWTGESDNTQFRKSNMVLSCYHQGPSLYLPVPSTKPRAVS